MMVETNQFPKNGSSQTPAHSFSFINCFKKPNFWLLGAMSIHKIQWLSLISQDFMTVETTQFPKNGSSQTPAHSFSFINCFKKPNFWLLGAMSIHKIQWLSLISQDFMTVETTQFPKNGSSQTPAHSFSEYTFRTFAPLAFRYFLNLFGIQRDDFLVSLCR